MKLIATGKNGYLNADYILGITVVEQADKFVIKVDFFGGTNAIWGTFDTRAQAIKYMNEFVDDCTEENDYENYPPVSRFS